MVMELLGLSLEDLFNICHRKFSREAVLMIADQMLYKADPMIAFIGTSNLITFV